MEIGISTYLYHDADIFNGLENLSTLGYGLIEVNVQCFPDSHSGDKAYFGEVAGCAKSLGLVVHSVHLGNCPEDIGGRDAELRQKGVEWIQKNIELCKVFTPMYVGIHRGGLWEDLSEPEHFQRVTEWTIESTGKVRQSCKEIGSKLEVETSGGYCDVKTIRRIVESFPGTDVGILVDTGHCWRSRKGTGNPVHAVREAGSRLFGLHIHDNHRDEDEHLVPGEGTIDWAGVVEALGDVDYKGIFMLECFRSRKNQSPDAIARMAKEAVDKILSC